MNTSLLITLLLENCLMHLLNLVIGAPNLILCIVGHLRVGKILYLLKSITIVYQIYSRLYQNLVLKMISKQGEKRYFYPLRMVY